MIFESLFCIGKRLNKRIYLYGLNEDTKKALIFLASFDVSVEGFLLTKEQDKLNGICYLGCSVINRSELMKMDRESYIILDVYGENILEIEDEFQMDHNIQILFATEEKHIAIYGAGESGKCLYKLFQRCKIGVDFFCDKNGSKIAEIDGCPVIVPDELDSKDKDCFIVIAIADRAAAKEVEKMLHSKKFLKVDLFNSFFWKHQFTEIIWAKRENQYWPVFEPRGLRYLYRILMKKRKVYLFGDSIQYLADVMSVLKKVGVVIHRAVSLNIDEEVLIGDFKISNAYQLIYEDLSDCVIWVLTGEEENARKFMNRSGICRDIFVYGSTAPLALDRLYVLDTHLGYMDSRGSIVRRNCPDGDKAIRVGILGGSTSDYDVLFEKSWPACLLDLAWRKKIKMEVICAATAGNTSAMELIRLIRDILWKKPNIVISFSRVNEIMQVVGNHRFAHIHQKAIFDKLAHAGAVNLFVGFERVKSYYMGEEIEDPAYVWLNNERMMHAVCEEFGIPFYAFLQPFLNDKKPQTLIDREVIEHSFDDPKIIQELDQLAEDVKKDINCYSWLYDFTEIFDNVDEEVFFDYYHVLENANQLIAEKILSILIESKHWEENI